MTLGIVYGCSLHPKGGWEVTACFDSPVSEGAKLVEVGQGNLSNVEVKLTYNHSTLVKVEAGGQVLYEVDISPKPYYQVCFASGWGGDYDSYEEAQQDCYSLLGYSRSIRCVNPEDPEYMNPYPVSLTEKIHKVNNTVV